MRVLLISITLVSLLIAATPTQAQRCSDGQQACHGGCISATAVCLNVPLGQLTEVTSFAQYFQTWYSLLVGGAAVLAVVMIMWAGTKWLASRGNSSEINEAKQIIWSSVIGLSIALLSYTILFFINPNLVRIGLPYLQRSQNVQLPDIQSLPGSHGNVAQEHGPASGRSTACTEGQRVITFDNTEPVAGVDMSQYDRWFDQYGRQYEVDSDLLRAIAMAESSGDQWAVSQAGACGLMQFMPETANGITGQTLDCADLQANPELSINLAAQYIAANRETLDLPDIIAGYNGGYEDSPVTRDGEVVTPPLAPSRDCAAEGVRAYECCLNPGELDETQAYVGRVLNYYEYYQSN